MPHGKKKAEVHVSGLQEFKTSMQQQKAAHDVFHRAVPSAVVLEGDLGEATMQLVLTCLAFCLTLVSASLGQVWIPAKVNGFSLLGDRSERNITVEIFCDLLCPDCKQLWPTVERVMDCELDYLNVVFNGFPLPYHRNAMLAYTGLRVALDRGLAQAGPTCAPVSAVYLRIRPLLKHRGLTI